MNLERFVLMMCAVAGIAWCAPAARAATFTVDRTDDTAVASACADGTANDCSLRGAILAANALSEASSINVPAGTYVLSQSSTCTFRIKTSSPGIFTSSQIPLCLSKNISLLGAGAASTIIDGDGRGRALFVSADVVAELRGITVQNGNGGASFFASQGGGGIQNHGTLTLVDTVVTGNTLSVSTASGAGIENFGTLTLRRTTVSNNTSVLGSEAGGGIHNDGFYSASLLVVSESSISNNAAGSRGGGIANGATATLINSTISGNTATNGVGGGIANLHAGGNFVARLTAINSTISGNTSGTQGGGLAAFNLTTVDLNNVTISDNTAGSSPAASRSGGGVSNATAAGAFTLQNTLIAANRDLGLVPAPDCFAEPGNGTPLSSTGYNFIADATRCTIVGDTTGNITGADPQLGSLADNGAPTRTHALSAASLALDAGNPSAPGSGGAACTALDQRGFNRLQDGNGDTVGRCDIGAFELAETATAFACSGVRPNAAGNADSTYVLVYGSGFENGMTVRLTRVGEADIVGSPVTVDPSGAVAATSFALSGQPAGAWDVVITNPDGDVKTLSGGFTVAAAGGSQIWSDLVGPAAIRVGRPARFTLFVGNRGNVDARAVPLRVSLRDGVAVGLSFPITDPPFQPGQVPTKWSLTPLGAPTADNTTNLVLLLPLVPAGFTLSFEITLTASPSAEGQSYVIEATAETPLFSQMLDPQLVSDLVAGARNYASQVIGIPIPPELAPDLEQYVIGQFDALVENGRSALIANVGAQSQVYSRAHLLVDVARFGAVLAGAQPPAGFAEGSAHGVVVEESSRTVSDAVRYAAQAVMKTIILQVSPRMAHGQGGGVLPEGHSTRPSCGDIGGELATCIKGDTVLGIFCVPKGSNASDCGGGGKPFIPVLGKDPNDKDGPQGKGAAHAILSGDTLRYTIRFENLETASAAAQEVIITDQLDGTMVDLDTFSLGAIAFGDRRVSPPPGLSRYSTSVDLRPQVDLILSIDAALEKSTGTVTWHFLSLDPLTGQFTEDPVAGFLPPNVAPPEGDGSVAFSIEPKVTDIPICNQASIVFDVNEAIVTPEWCNTVDTTPPSSQVLAFAPTQSSPTFTVNWSGTDAGAGIGDYTIFVAENGGPFAPFVADTTATSGAFTGQPGSTYAFYSIARDAVGLVEAPPATPDAETMIEDLSAPTDTATALATSTPTTTPTATASATATDTPPSTPTPTTSPTRTSTDTPTPVPPATRTSSATQTATNTSAPTNTPTNTFVPTRTATSTIAPTRTRTPTSTPTLPQPPPVPCGDIDGDGRVTMMDVRIEAFAVRSHSRDSRFDLNQDGRVTVIDLVIVARQIGRSC